MTRVALPDLLATEESGAPNLRIALDHLRTQVFTTAVSLKIGAFAIGSAFAGFAADSLGVRGMLAVAVAVAGAGHVAAALTGLATRKL
jgi:MFS family permease